MQLGSLDLNLLVSLDALLHERSVSRAAARLGLSQPALSGALARLRRHFDDALLVRVGNTHELTPLAAQLVQRTSRALEEVERVFTSEAVFDPATSQRTFTVFTSDYAMAVLGPHVSALIAEAPKVRVRFEHHANTTTNFAESLRGVDAMVLPRGFVFDLPSADLFTDSWMCLVDAGNTAVGAELTMDDVATMPWVLTYQGATRFTAATRQLQLLGIDVHAQTVVESFLALPFYLVGTDRLALVQRRLVEYLTRDGRLRAVPCPWDAVPVAEALWWHPTHAHDPEHIWLRGLFSRAGAQLSARP